MLKRSILVVLPMILFLLASPARAAEEEEPLYDGYLLCLQEDSAALFSVLPDGVEPVVPEIGLYYAATLEDAVWFAPEEIQYIEPNYLVYLLEGEEDGGPWNLTMLGADTAALAGLDGSGVRVGVVDSGLYAEHGALADVRIIPGYNYLANNEDTTDNVGHGTFVAGLLTEAAPGVELVPLKCFDNRTSTVRQIIAAIRGGVDDYNCDILNMSFGLSTDSSSLRQAVEYAAEQGLILTAAVGNEGTDVINYPAGYESVIGVGMVGSDKSAASKSQRNASVFVTAPGENVAGPALTGPQAYSTGSGTSYACPHVTAAAALLLQAVPGMTAEAFQAALIEGAEDLGDPGYDETYGYGLLSVTEMLTALPLYAARTGTKVQLRAVRTGVDAFTQPWAASYSASGRMLDCRPLSTARTGDVLVVNDTLPFTNGAAQVKLFFLWEGTAEPAREPEERPL